MALVIVNGSGPPLGFSITSALKSVAKTTYNVAQDPRAQALVAAGAQAYAPDATARVLQTAHQVQGQIRRARAFMNQGRVIMVQPGQMPPPGAVPVPDQGPPASDDGGASDIPVQPHHGLLLVGGAVGAVLLILLLTK